MHKSKVTGRKMTIMTPPLALGQALHDAIEPLSILPQEERFKKPLIERFEEAWQKVEGKKGGFKSSEQENEYIERGRAMIARVAQNPGFLLNKTVKIRPRDENGQISSFDLPRYSLSDIDKIILCGKIDWLEYIEPDNSVHIVDFKTGKGEEDESSLQLPIYLLLAKNCQSFNVSKASYWYIDREDTPANVNLPNEEDSKDRVLTVAKRIKLARQLELLNCPKGGCFACTPFEAILRGSGEFVGISGTNQDIYILP